MHVIGKEETIVGLFGNGNDLGTLTRGVTEAVGKSFSQQSMRNPSHDEIRRRFTICMKWAKVFRGDLSWGMQRIVDELPNALRAELLGTSYSPPTRQCWIPADGA